MLTKKVNFKIDVGKKKAFEYETDTNLPKMHQLNLCIGKRGAGKTVSTINLVEKMKYELKLFIDNCFFRWIGEKLNY